MKQVYIQCCLLIMGFHLDAQNFIRAYSNLPFSDTPGLVLPEDCIQMPDGRFVITGYTGYILETDAFGNPLSTHSLFSGINPLSDAINYSCISVAGNNQVFLGGSLSPDSVFFAKIDLSSGPEWLRGYDLSGNNIKAMATTADGSLIALATSSRGASQSAIPVITKINSQGNLIWQKRYFNSDPAAGRMRWESMSLASNGDILIAGVSADPSPFEAQFVRLNQDGEQVWTKSIEAANNNNEEAIGLFETFDGTLRFAIGSPLPGVQLATGSINGDGTLINASSWSGFSSAPNSSAVFADGKTAVVFDNNSEVLFCDSDDNLLFSNAYNFPGLGTLIFDKAIRGIDNNLALFGGYSVSFFGDFVIALFTLPLTGETAPGFSTSISTDSQPFNPVFVNRNITDSTGSAIYNLNLSYAEIELMYDTLFANNPLHFERTENKSPFMVYPNPASNEISISYSCSDCLFELYDLKGQLIKSFIINTDDSSFDVTAVLPGTYFLCLRNHTEIIESRRVLILPK